MSPARRRKKRNRRKKRKNKNKGLTKFLLAFFVILALFLFVNFTTKYWSKDSKLAIAYPAENGDVMVSVFDATTDSVTNIKIPGDTQVNVARQLGTWRIKTVWRLGEDEGIDGELLAETVTRQFNLPVYAWASSKAFGFSTGEAGSVLKAAFVPYKTNLGVGDKIRLAVFSMGVKNFKRVEIDLANRGVLTKKELVDGEEGYIVSSSTPPSILAVFSDPHISRASGKTQIIDATGKDGMSSEVGEIVETVGLKVASILEVTPEDVDCIVSGKNQRAVQELKKIFDCEEKELSDENFDVVIRLGKGFASRF